MTGSCYAAAGHVIVRECVGVDLLGAREDDQALAVVRTLHRICRVYAAVAVLVPVFGLATAGSLGSWATPGCSFRSP